MYPPFANAQCMPPPKKKIYKCSAQIVPIFIINPRPACCEKEKGGEGERDICRTVEVYYPARIACGNPLYLLARQVEGGAVESPPPITHTPFVQFETKAVDL